MDLKANGLIMFVSSNGFALCSQCFPVLHGMLKSFHCFDMDISM